MRSRCLVRFGALGWLMVAWGCLAWPAGRASGAEAAAVLPPVPAWSGASEALVVPPDDPWITPAERTGLTATPGYDETVAYLRRLDRASSLIAVREFGRTAQGRPLLVVVAARDRTFSPAALRRKGRPTLLVQGGIHSGEIDGKDAGLMLLRDLAFRGKASLLDHANLLFVPVFNADGHERASEWNRPNQRGPVRQGWRTTAQNLNLNRDYMKADAPEMQAMLGLIRDWEPTLYLDAHVTDGLDHQYDVTFGYNGDLGGFAWSPRIGRWLDQVFRPAVMADLRDAGHIPGRFLDLYDPMELPRGLTAAPSPPRFSDGYGDLRHLPAVLIETHSLKPYRQRVLGTYVLIESALRLLGGQGKDLRRAMADDAADAAPTVRLNPGKTVTGRTAIDYLGVNYETYTSPATGEQVIRWLGTPKVYSQVPVTLVGADLELRRPAAYWVPVTKPEVIERLKQHGIRVEVQSEARTLTVEMYRLKGARARPSSGVHPFEARHTLGIEGVKVETRTETFPAGSVRVPANQPLGLLAMALLEPQCEDSLFAWGFFLEVLQRTEYIEGYVVAPMAERMLERDPRLRAEFEARLREDPAFAASPAARKAWFYERSPYYDQRYLLYPVGLER